MATITHAKVDSVSDWTQADLDAQIALGNYAPGTLVADLILPSDWNADHDIVLGADENFVTDAQLVVIGNTSGTNTGDQTTIVGITGTKAQFDTAVTDGNFLYVGDVTQYTDEMAQDAVGGILTDSSEIDFTYDDATPSITASLKAGSIDEAKLDASVNASLDLADSAAQASFRTISVSGQSDVVADSATDTLTLAAGSNITITTNATTDTITIAASGGGGAWGDITGTLSDQTDLQTALDGKADALTADQNYVTDAQLVVIGNTSGTNTGDQTSVTGNAGTATALQTARAIGGVSFDGTANIVPQTIQVADAAGDTTTFVMLAGSATGDLQPLTDAALLYNASTNALTATTFVGTLSGTASNVLTNANLTGPVTSSGNATSTVIYETIALSDEVTALTTGTGKMTWYAPYAGTLGLPVFYVTTAPTGAALIFDLNKNGTTVYTTNPQIEVSEFITSTSATPGTLNGTVTFAAGDRITFDIDQIGSTIAGAGAKVYLPITRS